MAELIAEFAKRLKPSKYPWNEWCDGQIRRLKKGSDFECSVADMRANSYTTASRRGLKAHTQADGDDLIIQFYKPEQNSSVEGGPA